MRTLDSSWSNVVLVAHLATFYSVFVFIYYLDGFAVLETPLAAVWQAQSSPFELFLWDEAECLPAGVSVWPRLRCSTQEERLDVWRNVGSQWRLVVSGQPRSEGQLHHPFIMAAGRGGEGDAGNNATQLCLCLPRSTGTITVNNRGGGYFAPSCQHYNVICK